MYKKYDVCNNKSNGLNSFVLLPKHYDSRPNEAYQYFFFTFVHFSLSFCKKKKKMEMIDKIIQKNFGVAVINY